MGVVFAMQKRVTKERCVKDLVARGGRLIAMGTDFATLQRRSVYANRDG